LSAVELNATLSATALFRRSVRAWWASGFDLLLTPTLAGLPPRLGEMATNRAHPMAPFAVSGALVPFTPAFNVSYQPAINVPLHWTAPTDTAPAGLPVGVHLVADYGREDLLIRVASQLEQASPWAYRHPF
jgi:amidase